MLPYELSEQIFIYLSPKDLDNASLVCRLWNDAVSDRVWKLSFEDEFHTSSITPVSTPFRQWRKEMLRRGQILQKWRRGAKQTDKTMNTTLKDATDIFLNLAGDEASAYCFNAWQGNGVAIDLERGKIRRRLHASRYSHEATPVTVVDGSRFGVVYGFFDGNVNGSVFSRDSTYSADYIDFPYRHSSAVTAVWSAKTRNFSRPVGRTISVATGSQDGTVFLTNGSGYKELQSSRSKVSKLEGCMYGSTTANDGESVLALYADGNLYQFSPNPDSAGSDPFSVKSITNIPLADNLMNEGLESFQCNDCAIIRTRKRIHVYDLASSSETILKHPEEVEITAFAVDTTFTSGTKNVVAALSNNDIYAWAIPPVQSALSRNKEESPENKIVLVNTRSSPAPKEAEVETDHLKSLSASSSVETEERQIDPEPSWVAPNPIGYDARLEESNKPQVTKLASNSVVSLVGGYNGRVSCLESLMGAPSKRLDSRISKTVLDIGRYSQDGFVPVTHIKLDPDPSRLRGLIAVRPAIQYFDSGSVYTSTRRRPAPKTRRAPVRRRQHDSSLDTSAISHELNEESALNEEFAIMDAENEEFNDHLRENYVLSDMEEADAIDYALMLSQQQHEQQTRRQNGAGDDYDDGDDDDEELRRALALSSSFDVLQRASDPEAADVSEEELSRIIEMATMDTAEIYGMQNRDNESSEAEASDETGSEENEPREAENADDATYSYEESWSDLFDYDY